MKKRSFLKLLGVILGGMSFSVPWSYHSLSFPKFWVWLRPDISKSDEEWKAIFQKLRAAGIEAVLPQIYASNEALFEIEGYEVKAAWLEKIIPIAHSEDIQIHAWMWTMPCNDPKMIAEHPEWYVVNRKGESAATHPAYVPYYKFLCPRRPEVRRFVQKRVATLASIKDLDGIHLDYVRMPDVILAEGLQPKYNIVQDKEYPEYDYCYCKYCRGEYRKITGVDPLDIEDPAADTKWYDFRYQAVNDMVNEYLVPEAKKQDKWITAAVFPNWESVRQQWHEWDLDGFLPMLYHGFYNEDYTWVGEEVRKAKVRLDNEKPVFAGLFLPHFEQDELAKCIEQTLETGADGFALFAHNNLRAKDFSALKKIIDKS